MRYESVLEDFHRAFGDCRVCQHRHVSSDLGNGSGRKGYQSVREVTVPTLSHLDDIRFGTMSVISATSELVAIDAHAAADGLEPAVVADMLDEEVEEIEEAFEALDAALLAYNRMVEAYLPDRIPYRDQLANMLDGLEEASKGMQRAVVENASSEDILRWKEELESMEEGILNVIRAHYALEDDRLNVEHDAIHGQIDKSLLSIVASVMALLLMVLGLGLLARRVVVAPLQVLTLASQRVGRGDFDLPPEHGSSDEIGSLNRAFRMMIPQIDQLIQDSVAGRAAIAESETRFRDFAEASSDWLWETDEKGRVVYFSGRFTDLTGVDISSIIGRPLNVLMTASGTKHGRNIELDSQRPIRNLACEYHDADGNLRFCRLSGRAVQDENGTFKGYRGTASDITEEVAAVEKAKHLGLHDSLTGLPNRVLFAERLKQALASRTLNACVVTVLYLDLDRFKEINDTLGHAIGDALLSEVSERLKACVGVNDTVARLGGDEFAIVQIARSQPEDARRLCEDIILTLSEPIAVDGQDLQTGASIGVAIAEPQETSEVNLLRNADIAMYRAKNDGRNLYRFHDIEMNIELQHRHETEAALRQAIDKNELELHYQPLIDAKTRAIVGLEALLRWKREGIGIVLPNDFIPLAEETGLIVPIGEWVIQRACKDVSTWPELFVAVNLSPLQFLHDGLVKTVAKALRDTGLPAHLLELEITENVFLEKTDAAMFQLDALKELGVRLVMDDFGTGYSSLSYLQRFSFDKLKLDRSFVAGIEHDSNSAEIARTVLKLGKVLGMSTTAEGVETETQIAKLTEEGCDQLQGFYFSKAVPKEKLTDLVAATTSLRVDTRKSAASAGRVSKRPNLRN